MLRINLLPRYIDENAKKKKWVAAWVLATAAVIALFFMQIAAISAQVAQAQQDKDAADAQKTKYDALEKSINDQNAAIQTIKDKQTFIADAQKYNVAWPGLFDLMRDVTTDRVVLQTLNVDPAAHQTLSFAGFAPNEMTIIQWWMFLRNNKDKFNSVYFNLPPHPYIPGQGTTAGAMAFNPMQGGGGFGGPPGGSAAMQAMMMGGGGRMGKGGMGMGTMGGGGGGFRPGAAAAGVGETSLEGRKGISFTATAELKNAMDGGAQAPTWPPTGAAPAGGGTFAGMPGMPPGMAGMGGPMGGAPVGGPPMGAGRPGMGGLRGKAGAAGAGD